MKANRPSTGILVALALAAVGCRSAATEAYLARVAASPIVVTTPADSADAVWRRARRFFAYPGIGLGVATGDLLQSARGASAIQIQRVPVGDSVRFDIGVVGPNDSPRTARVIALYLLTGDIDYRFVE